jgi:hypothetical protein
VRLPYTIGNRLKSFPSFAGSPYMQVALVPVDPRLEPVCDVLCFVGAEFGENLSVNLVTDKPVLVVALSTSPNQELIF